MDDLERVVKDTAAAIDRHVMTTMLEKHSFAAHCSAIKRFLLLGQVRKPLRSSHRPASVSALPRTFHSLSSPRPFQRSKL